MRVLVLGATGMLGHKLVETLSPDFEVIATRRRGAVEPTTAKGVRMVEGVDVLDRSAIAGLIAAQRPDAVLNAVGVVKQITDAVNTSEIIAINSMLPNLLAEVCSVAGCRLIHFSTDCVFTGARDSVRGADGYREQDPPDARDLYGLSKLLGESRTPGCLTLRTSIIGPELRGRHGLLEWFLAQGDATVLGFSKALFTGLPTVILAEIVATILTKHASLEGLYHVAATPISKYELLNLFGDAYDRPTSIIEDSKLYCDRRLDGAQLANAIGWSAPAWPELVRRMRDDSP